MARFHYEAQQVDELSLRQGDRVLVLESNDSGWWTGRILAYSIQQLVQHEEEEQRRQQQQQQQQHDGIVRCPEQDGRVGLFPRNFMVLEAEARAMMLDALSRAKRTSSAARPATLPADSPIDDTSTESRDSLLGGGTDDATPPAPVSLAEDDDAARANVVVPARPFHRLNMRRQRKSDMISPSVIRQVVALEIEDLSASAPDSPVSTISPSSSPPLPTSTSTSTSSSTKTTTCGTDNDRPPTHSASSSTAESMALESSLPRISTWSSIKTRPQNSSWQTRRPEFLGSAAAAAAIGRSSSSSSSSPTTASSSPSSSNGGSPIDSTLLTHFSEQQQQQQPDNSKLSIAAAPANNKNKRLSRVLSQPIPSSFAINKQILHTELLQQKLQQQQQQSSSWTAMAPASNEMLSGASHITLPQFFQFSSSPGTALSHIVLAADPDMLIGIIEVLTLGKTDTHSIDAILDLLEWQNPIIRPLQLFEAATHAEVAANESPNTLFRGKCVANMMMAYFRKLYAADYLDAVMRRIFEHLRPVCGSFGTPPSPSATRFDIETKARGITWFVTI